MAAHGIDCISTNCFAGLWMMTFLFNLSLIFFRKPAQLTQIKRIARKFFEVS